MKIKQLMQVGVNKLLEEKVDNPIQKTRTLLSNLLKKEREYLITNSDKEVDDDIADTFLKQIQKLKQGYPIQYITNKQEFMKMNFFVNEDVLIPQPDTEILIEETISLLKKYKIEQIDVLDLCTGSGAIGISIAKYLKNARLTMTDISEKALEIAKENAINNEVIDRCEFIQSDMFKNILNNRFNIIVSNPPYIKRSVIKTLDLEVQKEPVIALDGGEDGLEFYRIIVKSAYKFLKNDGILAIEIGYDQKEEVLGLLKEEDKYAKIYCKQDLSGNDRVIIATKK